MLSEIQNSYFENKINILEHIENEAPLFIYRYSEHMCNSCIIEDLEELKLFQMKLGSQRIFVLPAYKKNKYNDIILSNALNDFNYVNTSSEILKIPINSNSIMSRYFGVINLQGELGMIYFPVLGCQSETKQYFAMVKEFIEMN